MWMHCRSSGMPSAEVTSPWKEASSEGLDAHHNLAAHKSITSLNGKYALKETNKIQKFSNNRVCRLYCYQTLKNVLSE
jgi:hypothetical protein